MRNADDDLAQARFIQSLDTVGGERRSQRHYSVGTAAWIKLLRIGTHQPGWIYWKELYLFVIALRTWLDTLTTQPVGTHAMDVDARELLTRHRTLLLRDNVLDAATFAAADLDMKDLIHAWGQLTNWLGNRA